MTATIGITGGIGSGKSVVSRILRCNGYTVYDCDTEAKKLMHEDELVRKELLQLLGQEIYDRGGNLNRDYLASRLFSEEEIRLGVNAIVHKAVYDDIIKRQTQEKGLWFVESAILATAKLDKICDAVWIVEASESVRIKRVEQRDSLSPEQIRKRIASQNKELEAIPESKIVRIKNENNSPLLSQIAEKISLTRNSVPDFNLNGAKSSKNKKILC